MGVRRQRRSGVEGERPVRTVRIEDDLWDRILEKASEENDGIARGPRIGVSDVIRQLLREALDARAARRSVIHSRRTKPKGLRAAIIRRFVALEREEHGLVPIFRLRRELAEPREKFDRALFDLQREDRIALIPLNDPRGVPDDRLADAIVSPFGDRLYFIARGPKLDA